MTENSITQEQAGALAHLLHQIRPDWETKSIYTLLGQHRDTGILPTPGFGALVEAAVRAARNPSNRTPAIIVLVGDHWRTPTTTRTRSEPPVTNDASGDCPNHPTVKAWDCKPCRRSDPRPTNFAELKAQAAAQAQAARRPDTEPPTAEAQQPPQQDDGPADGETPTGNKPGA